MTLIPAPNLPTSNADLDAAIAVCAGYSHTLRYVTDAKEWRRWTPDTGRWTPFPEAEVCTLIAALGKTSDKQVRSGANYLRYLPDMQARAEEFDRQPYLFNVRNGTLNLRPLEDLEPTASTRPSWDWEPQMHNPADMLTQVAGTYYVPEEVCPRWDSFLARVLPDPEIRGWLQRLIGYALVGNQSEAVFPILHGKGANGKSTFVDVLGALFGEYGCVAEKSLFKAVRNDGHPTDRAVLINKRLARSEELPNVEMDEPKIKGLTGGDKISGRYMNKNFQEWDPTHTFIVHSNNEPRFTGTDDGIWRRVVLIPFTVQIPADEADPYLKEKLYRELPGILNWALAGYEAYCDPGVRLSLPPVLQRLREEYRADNDLVTPFVDRYEISPGDKVFSLRQEHEEYAKENGLSGSEIGKNYTACTDRLKELGRGKVKNTSAHNPAKGRNDRCWLGIRQK